MLPEAKLTDPLIITKASPFVPVALPDVTGSTGNGHEVKWLKPDQFKKLEGDIKTKEAVFDRNRKIRNILIVAAIILFVAAIALSAIFPPAATAGIMAAIVLGAVTPSLITGLCSFSFEHKNYDLNEEISKLKTDLKTKKEKVGEAANDPSFNDYLTEKKITERSVEIENLINIFDQFSSYKLSDSALEGSKARLVNIDKEIQEEKQRKIAQLEADIKQQEIARKEALEKLTVLVSPPANPAPLTV